MGWTCVSCCAKEPGPRRRNLHVVIVSSNRKGEAALDTLACRVGIGAFQRAAGEHGFLGIVEGDSAEFLPVAD